MKYVDYNGHHYGLYITYKDAYLYAVLVENNTKVCTLTVKCYQSKICTDKYPFAFVDTNRVEGCEDILKLFGVVPSGRTYKVCSYEYIEFNFKKAIEFNDKEMKRDKVKYGMVEIKDNVTIATSLIYYMYHSKVKGTFNLVTIDGWNYEITEKVLAKLHKEYNVPVYKQFRKEPFNVSF